MKGPSPNSSKPRTWFKCEILKGILAILSTRVKAVLFENFNRGGNANGFQSEKIHKSFFINYNKFWARFECDMFNQSPTFPILKEASTKNLDGGGDITFIWIFGIFWCHFHLQEAENDPIANEVIRHFSPHRIIQSWWPFSSCILNSESWPNVRNCNKTFEDLFNRVRCAVVMIVWT
jgi:hypothetical protein